MNANGGQRTSPALGIILSSAMRYLAGIVITSRTEVVMLRILAQISVYGTKKSIEEIASDAAFNDGKLMQCGLLRKPPVADSWCYSTAWYRFDFDRLDKEILQFLNSHMSIDGVLSKHLNGLEYAMLVLCPVRETFEHEFSFLLSKETLSALCRMGLALELAPATTMPDCQNWSKTS
jgi:hypothetical protein